MCWQYARLQKKKENKIKIVVWVWLCTTKAKYTVNENGVQKTWYAKVQRLWTNSMYTTYIHRDENGKNSSASGMMEKEEAAEKKA